MNETPPTPPESTSFNWNSVVRNFRSFVRFASGDGESPLTDFRSAFGNLKPRRILFGLVILIIVGYLLTGIYVVSPGEAAVVRRFGAVVDPNVTPGLHYRVPWPVDRIDIVNVSEVRREVVGLLSPEEGHEHPEPISKLQVLSGDTNVIDVEIIVQYQVGDPAAYLVNVDYAPHRLVRDAVQIFQGKLASLKRFKEDVREVNQGYECGLSLEGFNDMKIGDIVECFEIEEVAATLG